MNRTSSIGVIQRIHPFCLYVFCCFAVNTYL